jgi:NHL repeat
MFTGTGMRVTIFEAAGRRLAVAGLLACLCLTAALLLWAPAAPAATNNIFTVAGDGTAGSGGDDGLATAAQLAQPKGVAATADGGFLIADNGNSRVRRVSPAGTITTVAGDGTSGSGGDGGPATLAQLSGLTGVATTADGGFLIGDTENDRVRRVSPAGIITTAAGNGVNGFSGDGGPATAAQLGTPQGVAATADGGFLIADISNNRVRRVSPEGRITTVAGGGTLAPPAVGDGGLATAARLEVPIGVAATADGGFLIADFFHNRVRFVDADLRSPRGPQGPTGPQGATGPSGPQGSPGPAARAPLALALAQTRLTARVRRAVTLRYAATEGASVQVRVMRRGRTVARVRGRARDGSNSIRVRVPARAGRYQLRLTATTADGRVAGARAVLIARAARG